VPKINGLQGSPSPKRSILTSSPSGHNSFHSDGDEPLKSNWRKLISSIYDEERPTNLTQSKSRSTLRLMLKMLQTLSTKEWIVQIQVVNLEKKGYL
jgi:hypothetical protein